MTRSELKRRFPGLLRVFKKTRSQLNKWAGRNADVQSTFTRIFVTNRWGSDQSHSGRGSDLQQTAVIREVLPRLLNDIGARSLLDAPCGDFHWMSAVDLGAIEYFGADVVPALVQQNEQRYGADTRHFLVRNIVEEALPQADVILCRDCLVHLPYDLISRALQNFKKSGAQYLLTTTFPAHRGNWDIATGDWRPLNLQEPPFRFPPPVSSIVEDCSEGDDYEFKDKALALWKLDSIPL